MQQGGGGRRRRTEEEETKQRKEKNRKRNETGEEAPSRGTICETTAALTLSAVEGSMARFFTIFTSSRHMSNRSTVADIFGINSAFALHCIGFDWIG